MPNSQTDKLNVHVTFVDTQEETRGDSAGVRSGLNDVTINEHDANPLWKYLLDPNSLRKKSSNLLFFSTLRDSDKVRIAVTH